jgi:hypothetical protein
MSLTDDFLLLSEEEKLEFAIREMNKMYEIYEYWKQIAQNQRQIIETRGRTSRRI